MPMTDALRSNSPAGLAPSPRRAFSSRLVSAAFILVLLGFSLVYLFWLARESFMVAGIRYFTLFDDSMISLRYADNLASGHGLVWNPAERVEGITNLGWTLVMALIRAVGISRPNTPMAIQLINLALQIALLGVVFGYLRRRAGGGVALGATIVVALNGPLFSYSLGGFETTLQTLLVTAALLPLIPTGPERDQVGRRLFLVPLWCGLAFLVRPDSGLIFVVGTLGAWWLLRLREARSNGKGSHALLLSIIVGGAIIAGVLVFQKLYYHDWLPNTYHLKASADSRGIWRGLKYVARFILRDWQSGLLVGTIIYLGIGLSAPRTRRYFLPLALVIASWFGYIVWAGGDVFPLSRFFIPLVPLLATCAVLSVDWALRQQLPPSSATGAIFRRRLLAGFVFALLAFQCLCYRQVAWWLDGSLRDCGLSSVLIARALTAPGTPLRPADTVGVFYAGITPYYMPRQRFHDFLGKCDAHIARSPAKWGPPGHNKWDYDYSLGTVRPAAIITGATYCGLGQDCSQVAIDKRMCAWVASKQDYGFIPSLWLDPRFRQDYQRLLVHYDGQEPQIQWVYLRRDRLSPHP